MMAACRVVLVSTIGVLGACDRFGAGPCYHEFRDPIIRIQSATDSSSGRAILRLAVTNVSVGGQPIAPAFVAEQQPSSRITLLTDTLWCDLACGFGTMEGVWRFDLSASGYRSKTIQLSARYAEFDGGRPSFNSGSTLLRVQLRSLGVN